MLEAAVDATSTVVPITEESGQRNGYSNHNPATLPRELQEIYTRDRTKIYYKIFNIIHNHQDAEEILADTFVNAWKGYHKFRGESELKTWVYRIGTNLALNRLAYWQRRRRQQTISIDAPADSDTTESMANIISYLQVPYCFTQSIEAGELIAKAKRAIDRLPDKHRRALMLKLNDLSYEEISIEMGIDIGTVKSRLARARENLVRTLYGPDATRKKIKVQDKQRRY